MTSNASKRARSIVLDVFLRKVVGWAMETHLRTELMLAAIDMAITMRKPKEVIHHSDHGCQYTSYAFGKRCQEAGIMPSMGTAGDAYDNGMELKTTTCPRKRGSSNWSEDELAQFLQTGANSRGIVFGSMSDVIIHSTQYLSQADARSTAHYLKSLGSQDQSGQSFAYDANSHKALKSGDARSEVALIYLDNCAACHRPDGRGYQRVFPALAGNPVVEAKSPESVVSIILRGSTTPRTPQTPAQFTMPGFDWRLSDIQVMQVTNFVRSNWGNRGSRVTLDDVAHLRPKSHQP